MNLVAYVQLKRMHQPTGVGRMIDCLLGELSQLGGVSVAVLGSRRDYDEVAPYLPRHWRNFRYCLYALPTRVQQALWLSCGEPRAEYYCGALDVIWCTAECYVPVERARTVVTVHDTHYFEENLCHENVGWCHGQKWRIVFKRFLARADGIHAVSEFTAGRLSELFPAARSKIRVVPNPVHPRFFRCSSAGDSNLLRAKGLVGRDFVLVPGGLSCRKNAGLILEAWGTVAREMEEPLLVVAGSCEAYWVPKAREIGPSIRLLGYVDDDELATLYRGATVVWFPSRYEGFGIPVVEAMASGAPVLISDAPALLEVSGNAALAAPVSSARAHAELLMALLKDVGLRSAIARAGQAHARRFASVAVARLFQGFLESVR